MDASSRDTDLLAVALSFASNGKVGNAIIAATESKL
jgi:hypothetical protein